MSEYAWTTGVQSLDRLVRGVHAGDNIVWQVDSGAPLDVFMRSFIRATAAMGRHVIYVSLNRSPQAVLKQYLRDVSPERFVLVDGFTSGKGGSGKAFSDFYGDEAYQDSGVRIVRIAEPPSAAQLRQTIEGVCSDLGSQADYVYDSVTGMLDLWREERQVLDFFAYMCPRLHDLNTIAYWVLEKHAHTEQFLANLQHITQVVVDLSVVDGDPTLVVRKAEGRRLPQIGIPQRFAIVEDEARFAPEHREELEMAVLSEVGEAVGGALQLEKVFERTMEILAREMKMRRGTMVMLDRAAGDLKIVAAHGLSPKEQERGRYKIGEGVTGRVVQTGQPVVVADISQDPLFLDRTRARAAAKTEGKVSFVCVPLRVDNEVVGAISVDRDFEGDETLAKDQRLLQIIASLISQAIKINRMVMVEREALIAENVRLRKDLKSRYKFGNIIAISGLMQDVVTTAATVAKSNATVLIRGETGTGKELIASVLHYNSERANGPFIKVNCGALSEGLLESELFGHVRGAFTSAVEDRKGRFELAHKGTIFLDEVGSISERLQVKLLRVLQEREFERVGGTKTIRVDARVVAATNVDLEEQIAKGAFREDLYYRLNVIPIAIPPLRARREDVPLLVQHFLEKFNREYKKDVSKMSREVLDAMIEYPWPGNVRELESCIERAIVLCQDDSISMGLLPVSVRSARRAETGEGLTGPPEEVIARLVATLRKERGGAGLHNRVISRVERALLTAVLESNRYVQTRAADELGVSRNTLSKKMRQYGIQAGGKGQA